MLVLTEHAVVDHDAKETLMGHLMGLKEYLDATYHYSIFEQMVESKEPWVLHLHGHRMLQATIVEDLTYDVKIKVEEQEIEELPKIQIKFLYPTNLLEPVKQIVITNEQVKTLELQPIIYPKDRYFVKNKSLYPLMKQQERVTFTLLEGEVLGGIIAGFSRYDITLIDQGIPIVILRHSIYDLQNKNGQCFLKSHQEKEKDWEKSELFVS